jgi:O-antigen ligase
VMVTVVITTVVNDTDMARADRFLALVFAVPAYYYFKRNLIPEKYLWIGLILGAVIAAYIAVFQVFGIDYCSIMPVRATGAVHPIIFGDLALLMGVMSFAGVGWIRKYQKWMMIVIILSLIAGILASALSLTRGSWLILPFLFVLLVWYSSKRLTLKSKFLLFTLVTLIISSFYLFPQTGVQQRVDKTLNNFSRYLNNQYTHEWERHTSIGNRFEMWKAALYIFKDNPLFGVGWGEYAKSAQVLVERGVVNKGAAKYYHPHNQFISALAKGGVLGFSAIIILLFFPAIMFYKRVKNNTDSSISRIALVGLILVLGFISFGLTESVFERSRFISFYSFYLSLIMALTQSRKIILGKNLSPCDEK